MDYLIKLGLLIVMPFVGLSSPLASGGDNQIEDLSFLDNMEYQDVAGTRIYLNQVPKVGDHVGGIIVSAVDHQSPIVINEIIESSGWKLFELKAGESLYSFLSSPDQSKLLNLDITQTDQVVCDIPNNLVSDLEKYYLISDPNLCGWSSIADVDLGSRFSNDYFVELASLDLILPESAITKLQDKMQAVLGSPTTQDYSYTAKNIQVLGEDMNLISFRLHSNHLIDNKVKNQAFVIMFKNSSGWHVNIYKNSSVEKIRRLLHTGLGSELLPNENES